MSFTTRIKFLNNNKKKKDSEMTQLEASPVATSPPNNENAGDDAEKYVDIDGIKFKITESEEDDLDGEHNEDAASTTSSSHDLHKVKKRKPNQDAKKKPQKQKRDQKQQDKQGRIKNGVMLKVNRRKVSLGKLHPNTALYPVCRAWMINERESKYIDLDYLFTQFVKRPQNGLKLLKALIDDDISCVSLMPAPVSKEIEHDGSQASRTPTAAILGCGPQGNKEILDDIVKCLENNDTDSCPNTVGLLREHMQRWKRVKVNWKKHTRAYDEERYGVNFAILDTMFKMQMRKSN